METENCKDVANNFQLPSIQKFKAITDHSNTAIFKDQELSVTQKG